jgi:hypothetical protein
MKEAAPLPGAASSFLKQDVLDLKELNRIGLV